MLCISIWGAEQCGYKKLRLTSSSRHQIFKLTNTFKKLRTKLTIAEKFGGDQKISKCTKCRKYFHYEIFSQSTNQYTRPMILNIIYALFKKKNLLKKRCLIQSKYLNGRNVFKMKKTMVKRWKLKIKLTKDDFWMSSSAANYYKCR